VPSIMLGNSYSGISTMRQLPWMLMTVITLGADKAYDVFDFVQALKKRLPVSASSIRLARGDSNIAVRSDFLPQKSWGRAHDRHASLEAISKAAQRIAGPAFRSMGE
jgi:hypothetical protein